MSRQQLLLTLLASGIFAAVALLFRRYGLPPTVASFWDAAIYAAAFRASAAHANAYVLAVTAQGTAQSPFVYPPLFLHLGAFFYRIVHGQLAWHLFIALDFLALLLSPFLLSAYYLRSRWFTPALAILLFTVAPAFVAEGSFFTGNLANILYAAILLAGVPGVRRSRWLGFYLVLLCAGFIKPPMLAFLLLPLLLDSGQVLASAFTVAGVFVLNLFTRLANPAEYAAYLEAIRTQIVVHRDLGYGLVYSLSQIVLRHPALPHALPFVGQSLLAGTVVGLVLALRLRHWPGITRSQSVAAVLLAALLCNPRLQAYDLDQIVVPAVYLLVEAFLRGRNRLYPRLFLVVVACILLVLAFVTPQKAIYATGLLAICVLAATGLSSTERTPNQAPMAV